MRVKEEQRAAKHDEKRQKGEKRRHAEGPHASPSSPQAKRTPTRSHGPVLSASVGLDASALPVSIAGKPISLSGREFSSGRRGFFACDSFMVEEGGEVFEVQCTVQCTVVRACKVSEAAEYASKDTEVVQTPEKQAPTTAEPVPTPESPKAAASFLKPRQRTAMQICSFLKP